MTTRFQKMSLVTLLLVALAASRAHSSRFSLFEPMLADENSDSHTVSAGTPRNADASPEFGVARLNMSSKFAPQSLLPPRVDDISGRPSAAPATTPTLIKWIQSTIRNSGDQDKISYSKRQINVTSIPYSSEHTTASTRKQRTTEPPKRWSALENYYDALRKAVLEKQLYDKQIDGGEAAAYNQLYQESLGDSQLGYSQKYLPIYRGDSLGKQPRPVVIASVLNPSSQPFSFPSDTGDRQYPAYISSDPNSGLGSGALMYPPPFLTQKQQQRQEPIRVSPQRGSQLDFLVPATKQVIAQQPVQVDIGRITALKQTQHNKSPAAWPQETYNSVDTPASALSPPSYELRKLPELILVQLAQNRLKHQQETFGSLYDEQRTREQFQDEAHCGPRNQLYSAQAAPSEFPSHAGLYNGSQFADDNFLCSAVWVHERFALTLASCIKNASSLANLYVRTGEWNTNRNLTLAGAPGQQLSSQQVQRTTMIVRQVSRVHLFPKYQINSSEHNLALLEWIKPVDFLETPNGSPACQMQLRSSLRADSCWAPVRSITQTEYIDVEGEGDTKLRRTVKMDKVPVKLLASDDDECLKQTAIESFNFQHPNYICSADIRKAQWRLKLNQPDYYGSGIYCNEAGSLSLVSIMHPLLLNSSSAFGFMDLSYYRPWMSKIMSARGY